MKSQPARTKLGPRSAANRSRATNNAGLLAGVDGRSAAARRYHDVIAAVIADQGGVERCAEARIQLIRRFAAAAVLAETMEANFANGHSIDITEHAQLTSSMVRVAHRIGINRRAKDITPTLAKYLDDVEADGETRHQSSIDDGSQTEEEAID